MSRLVSMFLCLVALHGAARAAAQPDPPTPLERNGYTRISTSTEISAYLAELTAANTLAEREILGYSVQGHPVEALVLRGVDRGPQLRVLIIASQHGAAEPAGAEAALSIARALVRGDLQPLLARLDVVLVPNANPDGRDLGRRTNANGVNLNTDFVRAREPETRALLEAIAHHAPHALLDTHESAVLKRKSLGREGYLTDFDIQFEIANSPGVPPPLREFTEQRLLPALLERVRAAGHDVHRYIGEITSTRQVITHGGLSLRNLRNTAGVQGIASILVETRLDSGEHRYATWHNIAAREARQVLALRTFLDVVDAAHAPLLRTAGQVDNTPFALHAAYRLDAAHPEVDITLRRRDNGVAEIHRFPNHRAVALADVVMPPPAYLVSAGQDLLRPVLDAHGIAYHVLEAPSRHVVEVLRFAPLAAADARLAVRERRVVALAAPAGALLVEPAPRQLRQLALLLDPRSPSSVFRLPEFAAVLDRDGPHAVHAVHDGAAAGP